MFFKRDFKEKSIQLIIFFIIHVQTANAFVIQIILVARILMIVLNEIKLKIIIPLYFIT